VFILRENDTPIYLNPTPVYKHTINRKAKAEIMPRYKPFISYVEVMSKLSADDKPYSEWDKESKDNPRLPTIEYSKRKDMGISNHSLKHSSEGPEEFISLVDSNDPDNWYKAMVWLSTGHWRLLLNEAKNDIMHMVHKKHRDELFIKERVAAGKCVADRYGRYFR
jgi:hypothetical protein